jgi:hypothetical protein
VLSTSYDGNRQHVYIQQPVFRRGEEGHRYYLQRHNIDTEQYIGWRILKLNDKEPLIYISSMAGRGYLKDPNVRLNLQFGRPGYVSGSYKAFFGLFASRRLIPKESNISYILFNEATKEYVNITVPFIAKMPFGIRNAEQYWSYFCESPPHKRKQRLYKHDVPAEEDDDIETGIGPKEYIHYSAYDTTRSMGKRSLRILENPEYRDLISAFYDLGDKTFVFKISGFTDKTKDPDQTLSDWNQQLKSFSSRGYERLIIDVQDNGGGVICLEYALLRLLIPSAENIEMESDFISSELFQAFAKQAEKLNKTTSLFHYIRNWIDPSTGKPFSTYDWQREGVNLSRGNTK